MFVSVIAKKLKKLHKDLIPKMPKFEKLKNIGFSHENYKFCTVNSKDLHQPTSAEYTPSNIKTNENIYHVSHFGHLMFEI